MELVQLEHDPELVPEQPLRYLPAAQSWVHVAHEYPLPSAWLQDPMRYLPAGHVLLLHVLHVSSLV